MKCAVMRMPFIRPLAFAPALLMIGCNGNGSDITPTTPVVLSRPVVNLDSTAAVLQSSAKQMAQGTFVYGSGGGLVVNAGDVIVGSSGDGYLRIVRSVVHSGTMLQLETDPAALTDVISDGDLQMVFTAGVTGTSLRELSRAEESMLPGVTIENGKIQFNNVTLIGDSARGLSIRDGSIAFTPAGALNVSIHHLAITHFKASVSGSLTVDADLVLGSTGAFTKSDSIAFYTTKGRFVGYVGGLPVYVSVVTVFSFIPSIALDGQATVQTGFTASAGVIVGAEYQNNQWASLTGPNGSVLVKPLTIAVGGKVVGTLGLKAQSQIYLYGVPGPYLWAKPFLEADASVDLLHDSFSSICKAAINAGFGMKVKVLDLSLVDFVEDRDFLNLPISICDHSGPLTSTGVLSVVAGTNQNAAVGARLVAPLVVETVSLLGGPVAGVPVTFATPDGGSFQPSTAVTNAIGRASATWTLGPTPGLQIATATASGYNGSPSAVSALATNTAACPPTSYALGQSGSGVITAADCQYTNTHQSYDNYSLILGTSQTLQFIMTATFLPYATINIDPAGRLNTGFNATTGQSISEKVIAPAGNVYVRPAATGIGSTGSYTFTVVPTTADITGCENVVLMSGATAVQQLTSSDCNRAGHFADRYLFALEPGWTATIAMRSLAFDAALTLDDGLDGFLSSDDDSGGGTDAQIVYTNSTTDILNYYVYATSTRAGSQGAYTLTLAVAVPPSLVSESGRGSVAPLPLRPQSRQP